MRYKLLVNVPFCPGQPLGLNVVYEPVITVAGNAVEDDEARGVTPVVLVGADDVHVGFAKVLDVFAGPQVEGLYVIVPSVLIVQFPAVVGYVVVQLLTVVVIV